MTYHVADVNLLILTISVVKISEQREMNYL